MSKDYKKLYKKLVESDWFKKAYYNKSLGECPFDIPELAESEDERIRKEIIEFIQWSVDRHFMREDFHQAKRPSEWIAYLEKQKDSLYISETCKEKCKSLTDSEMDKLIERATKNHEIAIEKINKHCAAAIDGCKIEKQKEHIPSTEETELNSIAFLEQMGYTCIPPGKEHKPIDIDFVSNWLREHIKTYVNSEYNEFHKTVEYDGTINIEHLIEDLKKATEQQPFAHKNDFASKPAEFGDDIVEDAEDYTSKVECGQYGVAVTEAYIAGALRERKKNKPAEWSEDYREEDLQTRFAFYTYKDEDGILYLSNVFVEETSRNEGLGTKILAAAEKVAKTLGIITIRLKVKQDSPANAWYRKHGYGYLTFEDGYDWLEKRLEYLKPKQEYNPAIIVDESCFKTHVNCVNAYYELRDYLVGLFRQYVECETPITKENIDADLSMMYPYMEKYVASVIGNCSPLDDHALRSFYSLGYKEGKEEHWKPSEEQMEHLKSLPELLRSYKLDTSAQVLEELYEQLKRL